MYCFCEMKMGKRLMCTWLLKRRMIFAELGNFEEMVARRR